MPEKKPVVGLSWKPQLPIISASKAADGSHTKPRTEAPTNTLWKPNSQLVDGLFVPPSDPRKLNKLIRKQAKDTTGKNWFNMPAQTITPELQKDLKLLKNELFSDVFHQFKYVIEFFCLTTQSRFLAELRGAIDPKRHYKKGDSKSKTLPKYFQASSFVMGTVVDSPLDYYSGRLTKKERKATLAEELLSDQNLAAYRKRKVREIEEKNQPGGNEKWKIKGKNTRKRAKERRVY
ncbi:hypothetical protein Lal_00031274 [Lupinus albus]|nr:hypothetical protein Lal_00031274 [Lupinus albus]